MAHVQGVYQEYIRRCLGGVCESALVGAHASVYHGSGESVARDLRLLGRKPGAHFVVHPVVLRTHG
eukprot:scaffold74823_cov21-Tisochrysis_lutea.AAC.2